MDWRTEAGRFLRTGMPVLGLDDRWSGSRRLGSLGWSRGPSILRRRPTAVELEHGADVRHGERAGWVSVRVTDDSHRSGSHPVRVAAYLQQLVCLDRSPRDPRELPWDELFESGLQAHWVEVDGAPTKFISLANGEWTTALHEGGEFDIVLGLREVTLGAIGLTSADIARYETCLSQ